MAAGQLSLTRRALLAGACAAPLGLGGAASERHSGLDPESTLSPVVRPPGREGRWIPDQVRDDEKWRRALDRFREADSRLAAAADSEDERLYDRLGARHDAAIKALLRTPAPTLADLAFKVDLLVSEQAWEMTGGELSLGSLRRDVHRFARG